MKRFWNKYTRAGLIIFVGILIGGLAFVLNQNMISNQVQTKQVIVAKEDIPPFAKITKQNLEYKQITLSEIPGDAVGDASELDFDNLFATEYGLIKGSPLRRSYVTNDEQSKLGSAVGLKEGMLEIGVTTTLAQSAGDGIKPGVYVDVFAFIRDERSGENKVISPKENPKLKSILVKKRLNAEGTVPDPNIGNSLIPTVAVLEVDTTQARDILEYQETGKVYLMPSGHSFSGHK